ncbi:MAG: hypothetical protein NC116_10550 [Clostridium sp.]|nr:hypothetical protein [Clostridium sp.]
MKEIKQNRNCLVYITHRLDNDIQRYLSFIKKCVAGIMDLSVLYDNASHPITPDNYPDLRLHLFNSNKLNRFFHRQNRLLANPLIALMDYAENNEYEHYLLMEYDIVLNGDLRSFIQRINSETDADYIHIATDVEGGPEKHWPIKYIYDNPFSHLHFAWCQLFYISRHYMAILNNFMLINDSFYYEFLLPTMAYNGNYVIRQFENYGYQFQLSWGPAELYENKYKYERMNNTFYHPIKNLSIVDFESI